MCAIELGIFAAPNYLARAGTPKRPEDAAAHTWVDYARGLPALLPPLPTPARLVGDDLLFLHGCARAGGGLALLPRFIAADDLVAGQLVRVLPDLSLPVGALMLVHPPAEHVSKKLRAFSEYLVDYFQRRPLASAASLKGARPED